MNSFATLLCVYILGGLTFLPVVFVVLVTHAYLTFPTVLRDPPIALLRRDGEDDVFKTDDEKLVRRLANSIDVAAGYFLVTREFVPGGVNGKPPERSSPAGGIVPQNASPSVYQSMYRSLFERKAIGSPDSANNAKTRGKKPLNEFFVVLRHGHLMLYDDEHQSEVRHVISLSLYTVSICAGGDDPIPEGELYIRRNAICLSRRPNSIDTSLDENSALPFYLFSENCSGKEDFYLALVKHQEKSSDDPLVPPKPLRYRQQDVISLVQRLHSSEDQLQMNWVNGLIGRVFLSVYRTPQIEQFIRGKIVKKISRVAKPNFLSDIHLQHIHVGDAVPYITNPRLKEMTADGDFCVEADISYSGNFRLEIATKALVNLGSRFKPREVNLLLAIVLKRLDGHGLIRIKPPPSNRLWFSFEKTPKMELMIEPIVGSRQVAWGPVLRIIESRIREVVEETVVLPHYDDIPFTDTIEQKFRGGIWHTAKKAPEPTAVISEKESVDAQESPTPVDTETEEKISSSTSQRAQTAPALPSTPCESDDQKAASIAGLLDPEDPFSKVVRPPSVRSKDSSKRKKAARTHMFNSITPTPPAPSIGTDTVNVTAVRERSDSADTESPASSAITRIRSHSSSGPQSQSPVVTGVGSPTRSTAKAKPIREFESSTPPEVSEISLSSTPESNGVDEEKEVPPPATPGIKAPIGATFPHPHFLGSNSRTSSQTSLRPPQQQVKPTTNAIGTATAAVKKWYVNRKTSASTPASSESPAPTVASPRNLPPSEVPSPPQKRTEPIKVPKRKPLPPQLPPTNRKSRRPSMPPLPPRKDADVLIVAAPDSGSTPTTPIADDQERDLDDLGRPRAAARSFDSETGSSRRMARASGTWERSAVRERAEEESELWHPAEEAEMRIRVPWEPDEL